MLFVCLFCFLFCFVIKVLDQWVAITTIVRYAWIGLLWFLGMTICLYDIFNIQKFNEQSYPSVRKSRNFSDSPTALATTVGSHKNKAVSGKQHIRVWVCITCNLYHKYIIIDNANTPENGCILFSAIITRLQSSVARYTLLPHFKTSVENIMDIFWQQQWNCQKRI